MDKVLEQGSSKTSARGGTRYTDEQREHYLNEYQKSGLSPFRFAQDKPFTRDTLVRWLEASPSDKRPPSPSKSNFVEIQMDAGNRQPMIIRLSQGCSIEIYHPAQIRWALDLMNAHLDASC